MDDENEPQSGRPPRPPARTEQLRIVGAEEAGALMDQANRSAPGGGPAQASGSPTDGDDNGRQPEPDDDQSDKVVLNGARGDTVRSVRARTVLASSESQ